MRLNKLTRLFTILIALAITNTAICSEKKVHIGIVPFSINMAEDITHSDNAILDTIIEQMENQDIALVTYNWEQLEHLTNNDQGSKPTQQTLDKLKLHALIWGEITLKQNNFTVNVNMLTKNQLQPIIQISQEGTEIATLLPIIKQILEQLTHALFESNIISEIQIKGNSRISDDAILELISTKPGDNFKKNEIAKDIRAIYNMACFDKITVERENTSIGLTVMFRVKESPILNEIFFVGNKRFTSKKIRETINIRKGSFLKHFQIHNSIEQITTLYKKSDYHNIKINYQTEKLDNNKINLRLNLEEGNQIFIDNINFIGNDSFESERLKKIINFSEKNKMSWLTGSGKLDNELLPYNENQLLNFYRSKGFINTKIGKTIIDIDNNFCKVTFLIQEGHRFRMGKCTLEGEFVAPKKDMQKILKAPKYEWFNVYAIQQDTIELTQMYLDKGFANAEISPVKQASSDDRIDLTYILKKNAQIRIRNVEISGNTVTRDNVIRRELKINQNNIYSKNKIGLSLRNLRKLNYFENITVEQIKYDNTQEIGLNFKVQEKPTGQIAFGAGYSSTDKFFVTGSISQENLFGKGQSLKLSGTLGNNTDRYNLSFNEPWLFGIPLSCTLRLYKDVDEKPINQSSNLNNSDKNKKIDTGLFLGISYPLSDFISISLGCGCNVSEDQAIDQDSKYNSNKEIAEAILEKRTSRSMTLGVLYDSRDNIFYSKEGSKHRLFCTYTGFGGDLGFVKLEPSLGYHIPLSKSLTLSLRSKYGHIKDLHSLDNEYFPMHESDLYRLGGMDSIRAYDYNTVGVETKDNDGNPIIKSGHQFVLFNLELTYPIYADLNVIGVAFYDAGQVFDRNMNIKLNKHGRKDGVGFGIRWFSPIGPIRLEAAYKLKDSDKEINWNFAIGTPF